MRCCNALTALILHLRKVVCVNFMMETSCGCNYYVNHLSRCDPEFAGELELENYLASAVLCKGEGANAVSV